MTAANEKTVKTYAWKRAAGMGGDYKYGGKVRAESEFEAARLAFAVSKNAPLFCRNPGSGKWEVYGLSGHVLIEPAGEE